MTDVEARLGADRVRTAARLAALIGQAERHLAEIDAALARVADRSFGVCAVCA